MPRAPASDAVGAGSRRCAACSAPLTGRYCAHCGEKVPAPGDLELSSLAHDALHDFFHFDGKLVRSLSALFAKPGLLAQEYFAGRRSRYARPLALFIFLNVVFFLVQPHTGLLSYSLTSYIGRPDAPTLQRRMVEERLRATGESLDVYRARFDAVHQGQKKSFLVFVVPIFALCLKLAYLPRRRRYAEHLVLAVHFYAVYMAVTLAIVLLGFLVRALHRMTSSGAHPDAAFWRFVDAEPVLAALLLATLGTWLYFALRRFYGDAPRAALVRTLALFVAHIALMFGFREVLFWTTFAAT